jgi:hypothetical protein
LIYDVNIYKVCVHRRHNPFFPNNREGKGPSVSGSTQFGFESLPWGKFDNLGRFWGEKIATEAKEVLAEIKGDDWRSGMRNPNGIFAGRDGRQR